MYQYQFVIPNFRDSDKKPHDSEAYNWLAGELLDIAGGFTDDCVRGSWRDDKGRIVKDSSLRYTVALEYIGPVILRYILQLALLRFDQQCIYFVHPDGTAELVRS